MVVRFDFDFLLDVRTVDLVVSMMNVDGFALDFEPSISFEGCSID